MAQPIVWQHLLQSPPEDLPTAQQAAVHLPDQLAVPRQPVDIDDVAPTTGCAHADAAATLRYMAARILQQGSNTILQLWSTSGPPAPSPCKQPINTGWLLLACLGLES